MNDWNSCRRWTSKRGIRRERGGQMTMLTTRRRQSGWGESWKEAEERRGESEGTQTFSESSSSFFIIWINRIASCHTWLSLLFLESCHYGYLVMSRWAIPKFSSVEYDFHWAQLCGLIQAKMLHSPYTWLAWYSRVFSNYYVLFMVEIYKEFLLTPANVYADRADLW